MIIVRALEEPIRQLATNAGLEGSVVVDKIRNGKKGEGLNVDTGEYIDLVKAGIIDPTMVTRSALQNAASIAKNIITTEAIVAEAPEKAAPCRRDARRYARHDVSPRSGRTAAAPKAPGCDVSKRGPGYPGPLALGARGKPFPQWAPFLALRAMAGQTGRLSRPVVSCRGRTLSGPPRREIVRAGQVPPLRGLPAHEQQRAGCQHQHARDAHRPAHAGDEGRVVAPGAVCGRKPD